MLHFMSHNPVTNHVTQGAAAAWVTVQLVLAPSVVVVPWLAVLALKKAVAVLGTACVTIPAAEGAACKDYTFGTVAVGGTLVSCCLTASLPWLVDHIRGDCVINSAAVEVSRIKQKNKKKTIEQIMTSLQSYILFLLARFLIGFSKVQNWFWRCFRHLFSLMLSQVYRLRAAVLYSLDPTHKWKWINI